MSSSPMSPEDQHRKKRVRNWTPNDRAKHKVFEKERREAFNQSLLDLANLLPGLADLGEAKLSKHIIVAESVQHHKRQQTSADELMLQLRSLVQERDGLLAEVNRWRQTCGLDARVAVPAGAAGYPDAAGNPRALAADMSDVTIAHAANAVTDAGIDPSLSEQPSSTLHDGAAYFGRLDLNNPALHVPVQGVIVPAADSAPDSSNLPVPTLGPDAPDLDDFLANPFLGTQGTDVDHWWLDEDDYVPPDETIEVYDHTRMALRAPASPTTGRRQNQYWTDYTAPTMHMPTSSSY